MAEWARGVLEKGTLRTGPDWSQISKMSFEELADFSGLLMVASSGAIPKALHLTISSNLPEQSKVMKKAAIIARSEIAKDEAWTASM